MSNEDKTRALWNTLRQIASVAKELGYYTHIDSSFCSLMEVTFRKLTANGYRDGSEAGYLGNARTMFLEPIKLSDRVPQDIRDAVASLLAA